MSLAAILIVIFVFAFFMRWMDVMAKDRQARMKLLEEAVKSGNLDQGARDDLVSAMTGRRHRRNAPPPPPSPDRSSAFEKMVLFVGWMGFLVGTVIFIYGASMGYRYDDEMLGGAITGTIGFGLVTYPFVVRELEGRRTAKARG